jgi:hypothetical protein
LQASINHNRLKAMQESRGFVMVGPGKRPERREIPVPRMAEKPKFLMMIGKLQVYVKGGKYVDKAGGPILLNLADHKRVTGEMKKKLLWEYK